MCDPIQEDICIEGSAKWAPCSPGGPGAEKMTWSECWPKVFLEPASLKVIHFSKAIEAIQPRISELAIRKFEDWTSKFSDF